MAFLETNKQRDAAFEAITSASENLEAALSLSDIILDNVFAHTAEHYEKNKDARTEFFCVLDQMGTAFCEMRNKLWDACAFLDIMFPGAKSMYVDVVRRNAKDFERLAYAFKYPLEERPKLINIPKAPIEKQCNCCRKCERNKDTFTQF